MNRSRVDPLGVPGTEQAYGDASERRKNRSKSATALDRWIVSQLTSALDASRVRAQLWDDPDPPAADDQRANVRIADRAALWQLAINPGLHFGDLYSAGRIEVDGDLLALLDEAYRYGAEKTLLKRWLERGRITAPSLLESRRNIHHHYDIGNDFYELWLDRDYLQYTCAYFADPAMTIEQAQQAKMHHVCRKLRLEADERVVEAGSGWGGFAIFMAKNYGVRVRSFNISKEQVAYAREWAEREQLTERVEFVEDDYRNMTGEYDAFASIGMLEHVGAGNYKAFGALISRVLTPNGRGLVHSIGRDRPEKMNAWIDKRIFPGAYPPTLREMMDLFEPNGLSVLDVENIRLHYAETLRAWLSRYEEHIDAVRSMFDEPFVRAWRLYLSGSIVAFLRGTLQLFQISFARTGQNQIPWTRADIYSHSE
jgi:cyclopropane-fatty-acyl-phospholipid synthase